MNSHVRDGLLAVAVGLGSLALLAGRGALDQLARVTVALVGVGGGLAVEAAFLADTPAGELWERPAIQVAGVVAVFGGGVLGAGLLGPWVLAAVCWGVVTYFAVLAGLSVRRAIVLSGG